MAFAVVAVVIAVGKGVVAALVEVSVTVVVKEELTHFGLKITTY